MLTVLSFYPYITSSWTFSVKLSNINMDDNDRNRYRKQ